MLRAALMGRLNVGVVESAAICSQDALSASCVFTGMPRRCVELVASKLAALLTEMLL